MAHGANSAAGEMDNVVNKRSGLKTWGKWTILFWALLDKAGGVAWGAEALVSGGRLGRVIDLAVR